MGDFNITDMSQVYRVLTGAGLKDTFREVGWGFGLTWPGRIQPPNEWFTPLVRLDYIWHTDEFHAESSWVGSHTASDHLPLIADFVYER
jgi:endonuclease/exonuclease/phosphatase (EEP) superfamily protein YafD